MPGAARLGDKAQVDSDAHGCPSCPHPAVGPVVVGSPDVNINKKPAARLDDLGIHAVCCGPNNFSIVKGSPSVYVNGKPLARLGDKTKHCGGSGPLIDGSSDVLIDDGASLAAQLAALAINAIKIAIEEAEKFKKGEQKKHSDTHEGGGGNGGGGAGGKGGASHKPVPTHDAHDAHKKDPHKKDPHKKDPHHKDPHHKDPHHKDPHKKDPKHPPKKEPAKVPVHVELTLFDADDPEEKLQSAPFTFTAYGKTHSYNTNSAGHFKGTIEGHKGGTFDLVVKGKGGDKADPKPHGPPDEPPQTDDSDKEDDAHSVDEHELHQIMPQADIKDIKAYVEPLNDAMDEFGIRSPRRMAAFLAQIAHESGQLKYKEEIDSGAAYQGILGNTHPGDGVKYKGRGLIQVTGRDNYKTVGKALKLNLIEHPRLLEKPINSCRASCYWWYAHGLNKIADSGDFLKITRIINGGYNGLADRKMFWARAKRVLGNAKK